MRSEPLMERLYVEFECVWNMQLGRFVQSRGIDKVVAEEEVGGAVHLEVVVLVVVHLLDVVHLIQMIDATLAMNVVITRTIVHVLVVEPVVAMTDADDRRQDLDHVIAVVATVAVQADLGLVVTSVQQDAARQEAVDQINEQQKHCSSLNIDWLIA